MKWGSSTGGTNRLLFTAPYQLPHTIGTGGSTRRAAGFTPPSSAENKNVWSYAFTPSLRYIRSDSLINDVDSFTYYDERGSIV
jgi:hypothetical protein